QIARDVGEGQGNGLHVTGPGVGPQPTDRNREHEDNDKREGLKPDEAAIDPHRWPPDRFSLTLCVVAEKVMQHDLDLLESLGCAGERNMEKLAAAAGRLRARMTRAPHASRSVA